MENSPAIRPDHEIKGKRSGSVHHFHKLRMKKKLQLFRRRNSRSSPEALIQQQWKWTPPCHTIFKCLIPSLLAVVGVKYQAISKDPFKTRPLHTWSFLISIFLYSLILFAAKQSRNRCHKHLQSLGRVALASGAVSSLSLISLLLPHFPGLLLLYTAWALSVLISTFPIIQYCTCNRLLTGIKTILDITICNSRNLLTAWDFSQQPPPQATRPPV
ncbi:hypothetical protein ACH5RR_023836 [Cinchona calisaya]|uniref:Uncharacterized protein n=1 Tax=Cinchona calisaya TaxID=153742 RepID=A0ABD2ZCV8_9GENT